MTPNGNRGAAEPGYAELCRRADPPVLVVTTAAAGERAGCVVTFATESSISPPRFLACLSATNRTFAVARQADALAVHLLGEEQLALAELFGGRSGDEVDKFALCAWQEGPHGMPVLDGCVAWFVGRVESRLPVGDHTGYLLEPVAGAVGDGRVLRAAALSDLTPGHAPGVT